MRSLIGWASAGLFFLGVILFSIAHGQEKKEKPGEVPDITEKLADLRVNNPNGLRLELRAAKTRLQVLEKTIWTCELINDGKQEVLLVQPGDGSESAWRTPAIQWIIDRQPPRGLVGRCGNINSLRPNEVFTVKPGQRVKLNEWVGQPQLAGPGVHKVSLRYVNLPDMQWRGLALGKHDAAEMEKVKRSTPVNLVSNEIEITIVK